MSASHYSQSLSAVLETFEALRDFEAPIVKIADVVTACLLGGNKLLFCGNGGSASDTAHIAAEFTCRFVGDRLPYPAISLAGDGGLLTAIGNDYGFEDVFARQVRAYARPGDVLIAATTSGKSRDILAAIEQARLCEIQSVAFLGKDGGFTKGAADFEIIVPGTVTARIQEAQKFLMHVVCELVEPHLKKE
ncbi:MAG: D-sedoheptulose-7-phosphate isomerase [Terrimicrobiaceae bacterium]|jgi:D-sedoheptulose 7-phosphate isomerase